MNTNSKSDVNAKNAYKTKLKEDGYIDIRTTSSPSDIQATKNGKKYYFEIKYTKKEQKYFGAATLTEWACAIENTDTYFFVVAIQKNGRWRFTEYTPDEFMQFSNIPPFKIYFNIPTTLTKPEIVRKKTKSVELTKDRIREMSKLFDLFRSNS